MPARLLMVSSVGGVTVLGQGSSLCHGVFPLYRMTVLVWTFFDLEQQALLGVANIFLECLFHREGHKYNAPIIGPIGKVSDHYHRS